MVKKHTEGHTRPPDPPAPGEDGTGRGVYKRGGRTSIPIKVDDRLLPLLNSLADWLNDYQYRVLMRLVIREIGRQKITLPAYKQEAVDAILKELGDQPGDVGKLTPVPMPPS